MVKGRRQGESRNQYPRPHYEETRRLAKARGFGLADICERIKAETEAGNWDLRVRRDDKLDASRDAEHVGDTGWFGNIHPDLRGLDVMADTLAKTLLGGDGLRPYRREERR
jgi:acyl-CoA thioesterase-1